MNRPNALWKDSLLTFDYFNQWASFNRMRQLLWSIMVAIHTKCRCCKKSSAEMRADNSVDPIDQILSSQTNALLQWLNILPCGCVNLNEFTERIHVDSREKHIINWLFTEKVHQFMHWIFFANKSTCPLRAAAKYSCSLICTVVIGTLCTYAQWKKADLQDILILKTVKVLGMTE